MTDVPAATPVTTPDAEPMVATLVVPLVQVPPDVALVNVLVLPTHTDSEPLIAPGNALTVTILVAAQPVEVSL
jgi:hypothetical protein